MNLNAVYNGLSLIFYTILTYIIICLPINSDIFNIHIGNGESVMWSNYSGGLIMQ